MSAERREQMQTTTAPHKDFHGQNLRSRSFKGTDLTDADFSNCDLRGVDFSHANLTRAKFCRARMGRSLRVSLLLGLLSLLGGLMVTFSVVISFVLPVIQSLDPNKYGFGPFFAIYSLLIGVFCGNTWRVSRTKNLGAYKYGLLILVLLLATLSGFIVAVALNSVVISWLVAASFFVLITAVLLTALTLALSVTHILTVIGLVLVSILLIWRLGGTGVAENIVFGAPVVIGLLMLLYLIADRSNAEAYSWILRNSIRRIPNVFATQFAGADLTAADFSDADVKYARFNFVCSFDGSIWRNAQNLHLAVTDKTPLALLKVRDLLTHSKVTAERDFSNLNLSGLILAGMDLRHVDFSSSDLSRADLTGCQLQNANLSACQLFGAKLDKCNFTGAIIENWGIDKYTSLDEIECDYVWLKPDKSERQPAEPANFKPTEFRKLYQVIAETVDFIAHNPAELAALLVAIDSLKGQYGNGKLYVQAVERKYDSVVVKVNKPDEVARQELYKQVLQEKESAIMALQGRNDTLEALLSEKSQQQDLLAQLLHELIAANKQVNIHNHNQIGSIMRLDQSRKIENSTLSNSNINQGDNSTVSCNVKNLPTDSELKQLLEQLQILIKNSDLADNDKQALLNETNNLAHVGELPATEKENKENIVRKTLRYFKGFAGEIKDVSEAAQTYGEILSKISRALGVDNIF